MRRTAFLVTALALMACDQNHPLSAPADLVADLPADAVQAVILQQPGTEPGTVQYSVRIVGKRKDMAAYQGSLTFDAADFEVVRVQTPTGTEGETHLVNSAAAPGEIRFAAYAPEQFGTDEAFTMTVKPKHTGIPRMEAVLSVAGTTNGIAVDSTLLRRSVGVRDVAGKLLK